MRRSRVFHQLVRVIRIGLHCDRLKITSSEGLERLAAKAAGH